VKRGTLAALTGAALMLLGPGAAHAAAPANDAFAAAVPLAVGEQVSGSNVNATVETGEPDPTGFAASDTCPDIAAGVNCGTSVWYTFQPAYSGQYTIGICDGGTDVYGIVGVYTGALGSLTQVGASGQGQQCASLGHNLAGTQLTFAATAGTVYHVDVTGHGGAQGSFYLRAYPGLATAPASPDTAVDQRASLANAVNALSVAPGVTSGPRRSGSFALLSDLPGATFECALDGGPFAACDSSVSYDGLAPGSSHVFRARAMANGVTDATPAVARFTIDSTPPDTLLLSGPIGPLASQMATWTSGGSERYNRGAFACDLDSMPAVACNNPQTFSQLCAGPHSFHAAALDYAANIDPTPVNAAIQVTTGTACAAPTVSPSSSAVTTATGALLFVPYDDKGAGGRLHVEYGPTTAYGMEVADTRVEPGPATTTKMSILYMAPNTLTHYRVTITTPFGSDRTGDQTLTTKPAEGPLPTIANGTPRVTGQHAASIPATIDPGAVAGSYRLLIAAGAPATGASAAIENAATVSGPGPQPALANIVDLDPATTYHYRFALEQQSGGADVLGPEGTFATPPFPTKAAVSLLQKAHFRLRKGQIRLGRLTRRSERLKARVHGLPAKTVVAVRLLVGGSKQTARKKANRRGLAVFKPALSKRIRKALHKEKVRHYMVKVTASPPGERPSSVTLTKKLPR
jgi:hypothetical protein